MTERSSVLQPYAAILPSAEETLLLRAGLLSGAAARSAWHEWQSADPGAFIGHNPAAQKLRLLLAQAHQRHHFEMDKESQTFLRLSYFKENLRRDICQRIFRSVLTALEESAIDVIVLKGVALAETVYSPWMRHCHDLDLLLDPAHIDKAAGALARLQFHVSESSSCSSIRLEHESRLPVELHTRLFLEDDHDRIIDEVRERAHPAVIFGVRTQVFTPEDSLLHVCAHAFFSRNRCSLRWVSDAWRIIEKHPDSDWQRWFDCSLRGRLTLPVCVTLGYLHERLGMPMPTPILRLLRSTGSGYSTPS